ncbi:type II toxin-antitoxin system RelE/ParE family toxin [Pseudorhizobium marinum]|uniref:type II toxin-antitoxin system RelE/ParE family toxin n=1 Tax=Pseudorhizobium marinum TaxID=1496690 RepID=UPI0012DCCAC2|nr:type II toxin-antitoxin system RelE/ParE family toxin [Pseudorhizobium marinum]
MTACVLTSEAEAHLRGIIRYTRKEWGTAQVRRYFGDLEEGIATLAAGQGLFTDMGEVPLRKLVHPSFLIDASRLVFFHPVGSQARSARRRQHGLP